MSTDLMKGMLPRPEGSTLPGQVGRGVVEWATAYAPAGVGNVAVGFDVLGHALDAVGDRVTVYRTPDPGVEILDIVGCEEALPMDPEKNTATAGLVALVRELSLPFGFALRIEKSIPLGSGMGGSASSAVGGLVAANALLDEPLTPLELLRFALVGETVASGSAHADNLAPGLFGGMTLVRAMEPPDVIRISVPAAIRCVLVRPHLRLDTRVARQVLPRTLPMGLHIQQSANLAGFVTGCLTADLELIGRSFADVIVEPHRAPLIQGFAEVKAAALNAGALGCSISGAGPSLFSWCAGEQTALEVRDAMVAAFRAEGIASDPYISRVDAPGARLVEVA
jgi:homoserine kinase